MSFLYPSFLWALAAVLVPVVIHLFNFQRYRKVYFSNVRFLKQLQMETRSRSRLRELLVLAARCLAVAALVLAFARPYIPDPDMAAGGGPPAVALYVDNSFSMGNVGRQGPLLAVARAHATDLVKAHGQGARFYVVTNRFDGSEQRWRTHDDAIEFIGGITEFPVPRTLSSVYARQNSFLHRSGRQPGASYFISDAQRSTFDLARLQPDTSRVLTMLPLAANEVNNLVADSCWFDTPVRQKGFRQKLMATIVNRGAADIEAGSARLYLNDRQVALSSFSVQAGSTATISFSYFQEAGGFHHGRITIEDYPVTFDDELYFAYDARMRVNVVLIDGAADDGSAFKALFANDSVFSFRSFPEQTIDYGAFSGADLIVLNQLSELSSGLVAELRKYSAGGGGVVIIPPGEITPSYQAAFAGLAVPALENKDTAAVTVAPIDQASGFFAGVFERKQERMNLPLVRMHYSVRGAPADRLLQLANGDDFLFSQRSGQAVCFVFTSPLSDEYSNFSRHALFVPSFYRMAMLSMAQPPLYYYLHPDVVVPLRGRIGESEQPPHIVNGAGAADVIPEKRTVNNMTLLFPRNQLTSPGFYTLKHDGSELMPLAFNYSRVESDLSAYDAGGLRAIADEKGWRRVRVVSDTGETIRSQVQLGAENNQVWKLFILLALVFFLAECLLLRFLR